MTDLLYAEGRITDRTVLDCHYSKIGTIADVYVDDVTNRPEWVAVKTGLFGTKITFVPLTGAHVYDGDVVVRYDASMVNDAPKVDPDEQRTAEQEAALFHHYGIDLPPMTGSGEKRGGDVLRTGTARLRRWVESQDTGVRLPIQHEKVRVITEPDSNQVDDWALAALQAHRQSLQLASRTTSQS
jgi:hypothetical protein